VIAPIPSGQRIHASWPASSANGSKLLL
jgi:hypothetical protein